MNISINVIGAYEDLNNNTSIFLYALLVLFQHFNISINWCNCLVGDVVVLRSCVFVVVSPIAIKFYFLYTRQAIKHSGNLTCC